MPLSIQETVSKIESYSAQGQTNTLKDIKEMLDHGFYDYNVANVFGTGVGDGSKGLSPQKPLNKADVQAILETLRTAPLKEFIAKSGTTGIMGAIYLIPQKIHQVAYDSAAQVDVVPEISGMMIPADQIPGATLDIVVGVDGSYKPQKTSSGGKSPEQEIKTVKSTLNFNTTLTISPLIGNDLLEDTPQFDVIEMHVRNAGKEMGQMATEEAIIVLDTPPDGDGVLNTEAANSSDFTEMEDVAAAILENAIDKHISDTMVLMHEQWFDKIIQDTTYSTYAHAWRDAIVSTVPSGITMQGVSNVKVFGLNMIFVAPNITMDPDGDQTECRCYVFRKDSALISGRKRWLRLEEFSNPLEDLKGFSMTSRQDSVTIYKDAICRIAEA